MSKWNTEWITHPEYPGWRKRRLISKDGMMQALIHTNWERIPGSDPTLPGPPGAEGWGGLFPREKWPERKRPDWGKFPIWPEWPPRRKQPPMGSYPGDPEGREPKPYRPPFGTHEMPGIPDRPARPPGWHNLPEKFPDGFNPFLRPNPYRPPTPAVPWGKFPERKEPDWWKDKYPFFPKWKDKDLTPLKPMPMPYNPPGFGSIWDKFPRRKFDGNEKDFLQLLKDAQVGSAMPKLHKSIDPLSQYPHYGGIPDRRREFREENVDYYSPSAVDEAGMTEGMITWGKTPTGRNTRSSAHPLSTADLDTLSRENRLARESAARGPQLGGVPEGDRKFVDTMHNIQNAYFTGADFGYEEGWAERLGATQEQIDMFMAVPEEALRHAMNNPTDAVLQQFEEYYGFPLNVNDPDMQKYFGDRKKRR